MLLYQFPWSPYCLVQRRILEFSGARHRIVNIPPSDRSRIWKLSRQRYYQVPLLQDGKTVVFEIEDNSQVIAKYLELKLRLGLFPPQWDGLQNILWRYIESDVEGLTFKLNDAQYRLFVPQGEQMAYLRHKERKFGRGCLDSWRVNQKAHLAGLTALLAPFERMLARGPYLLDDQPRFIDFDLWGMLANFLYSGRYSLPSLQPKIRVWHRRMSRVRFADSTK
ncbi:MAG: glutathione S-transferase [Verrucomicrobiota bacterium]